MKVTIASMALFVAAACSRGAPDKAPGAGGRDRVAPVSTAVVQKKDVAIHLDGLGTVTANKTVTIRAQVDGRLDQVLFREGQAVHRGDVLAQLDARPFLIQLHQAQGAKARDEAQLEASRRDLKRYDGLVERKLIAPQQADDQKGSVGQLEGAVRIDEAQIETARLNLSYARITSPIDGVAGIRGVDQGNYVRASDPNGIVVLTQLDPIAVIFTLSQDELPRIAAMRQRGELSVEVYGRDGNALLGRGRLEVIDNAINAATATLRLKAILPNPQRSLWPNQFVKTRLLLTVRRDATVIPSEALQRGPDGTFVYVVNADQTAQPRPVTVDLQQGEEALVASGVAPGEVIVTEGQNQLKPGSKVQARQAPPAKGGSPAEPGRRARGEAPADGAPGQSAPHPSAPGESAPGQPAQGQPAPAKGASRPPVPGPPAQGSRPPRGAGSPR